jgi:integrase
LDAFLQSSTSAFSDRNALTHHLRAHADSQLGSKLTASTFSGEPQKDLLDKAGLPHVDQYATRHTTAALLDELGVSEDVRMQIMGHSSKVDQKAYPHVDKARARAALTKLETLLSD